MGKSPSGTKETPRTQKCPNTQRINGKGYYLSRQDGDLEGTCFLMLRPARPACSPPFGEPLVINGELGELSALGENDAQERGNEVTGNIRM